MRVDELIQWLQTFPPDAHVIAHEPQLDEAEGWRGLLIYSATERNPYFDMPAEIGRIPTTSVEGDLSTTRAMSWDEVLQAYPDIHRQSGPYPVYSKAEMIRPTVLNQPNELGAKERN